MSFTILLILIAILILCTNSHWLLNKKKYLFKNFEYYRNLNETDREEFIRRVDTILQSKVFIGKEGMHVTSKMKVSVAAAFAQLTFGFKNYLLPHYRQIFIYPDAYINHATNKLYKGETNTNGFIKISWNHFVEGYRTCDDRINLGLHETSHALLNTIIYSDDHDPELDKDLLALDRIPAEERNRLFSGSEPFFRDYAQRNIKEFFAVAIESFFEAPVQFKNEFPEFYTLMCKLLNQEPVNKIFRAAV